MKNREKIQKRGLIIGAIAGTILFTVFGILPGSLIGGVMGLNIAEGLFGSPVSTDLVPRIIVATAMVVGVFVSGIITVLASALLGMAGANILKYLSVEKKGDVKVALKG